MGQEKQDLDLFEEYIDAGQFQEAVELLGKMSETDVQEDILCILTATLYQRMGNTDEMYDVIRNGLAFNGRNYELYVMLGDYYQEKQKLHQAYLCYENALFYCDGEEDSKIIEGFLWQLRDEMGIIVPKTAIVILSYNLLDMTKACIESIRRTVPANAMEMIVVDNASTDGSVEWLKEQRDVKLLCNTTNEGYPKGCNQGIAMAEPESDIFLLNNDTLLPDNALFWLRMGLYEEECVGSAGSLSNKGGYSQSVAANPTTPEEWMRYARGVNIPAKMCYEEKIFLFGFALLLKRSVLKVVGMLDEHFTPGMYEDNDLGLRILLAGYKNLLCWNSFIFHYDSQSFIKNGIDAEKLLELNREKFLNKWNQLRIGYSANVREDIISLMEQQGVTPGMKILEIGCGCGVTLARLKRKIPDVKVYGMEYDPMTAEIAGHLADVVCVDVEELKGDELAESFDCIIMGDVLEHLRDPQKALREIGKMLKADGYIVASLPNLLHYSVMLPLLRNGLFTYEDSGILDRTHLHMFTKIEMFRLFQDAGMKISGLSRNAMNTMTEEQEKFVDMLTQIMVGGDREQFITFQYLLVAEKRHDEIKM